MVSRYLLSKGFCAFFCVQGSTLLPYFTSRDEGFLSFSKCRVAPNSACRDRIFKEPRNRFQGINSASLCSLAGRYDNPILLGA